MKVVKRQGREVLKKGKRRGQEKKTGEQRQGSLIVRKAGRATCFGGGEGKGRESQESCWRRSRYWVFSSIGQAEWPQGLVRQTLVEHRRHVVTASCGSHHQTKNSDWLRSGWQNVGFSACLE